MNDVILDFHQNLSRLFDMCLCLIKNVFILVSYFVKHLFSLFLSSGLHFNAYSQYEIDKELTFAICSISENVGV